PVQAERLTRDALERHPHPLDERAAAIVVDARADLDAVQAPRVERLVEHCAERPRHRPATLRVGSEPVADARRAVLHVDAVKADHADDPPALEDRRLAAVPVANLFAAPRDEARGVLARLLRGPWQPAREVRAV